MLTSCKLKSPLGILSFFLCLLLLATASAWDQPQKLLPREPLIIATNHGEIPFQVEVATTHEQQERGLMFRTHMAENEGMLFPTPLRTVKMWMKNTLIPLDMLFIDQSGTILHIVEQTEPESIQIISYPSPVSAVLELSGGTAARENITEGDHIIHPYFKP